MNRGFLLLWQGQAVSQLGNQAFTIAMLLWASTTTGSASLVGLLMVLSLLPGVVLAPFGGTFADRHSRIRILIACDLAAGAGVLLLAAGFWAFPGREQLNLGLLLAAAVLLGVLRALFLPAVGAVIPDLVPAERLPAANSLNQVTVQVALLVGQAAGGVLYARLGAALLFLLDGVTFFYAALSEALIPRDEPRPVAAEGGPPLSRFLRETGEGLRFVWGAAGLRDFAIAASLVNLLSTPMITLFPFYVERYLQAGPEWYGFLVAGVSGGSLLGFALAGTLRLAGTARAWGILGAMFLYPIFFGALAFTRAPLPALAAVVLGGITVGLINVYLMTMIQSATPAELRGRVMGLLVTLTAGLMPIGMALGGVIGDLTGKNVPAILTASAVLALLVTAGAAARRDCRRFLATG
jgi:MFS family permease